LKFPLSALKLLEAHAASDDFRGHFLTTSVFISSKRHYFVRQVPAATVSSAPSYHTNLVLHVGHFAAAQAPVLHRGAEASGLERDARAGISPPEIQSRWCWLP